MSAAETFLGRPIVPAIAPAPIASASRRDSNLIALR
jgi:hypothetical protein